MLLRKLFRTVGIYKSQFISMIIMIGIGIGVFLGFNIEWHSIKTNTTSFFQKTNYADFRLYSDAGFSAEDIAKVKKIEGVKAATRYFSVNVGIKDKKQTVTLNVSEDYNVSTMLITSGKKYAETSEGVWISDRFADENNIDIGDEIIFEYQGAEIRCEVIGLAKSGENMICVADSNQIMPDFSAHGFAYITPSKLESCFGTAFYPQINIVSDMKKNELEEAVKIELGKTIQTIDKELHTAYAGAESEAQEGKAMGSVLPILFLAIAILTMLTTMHRITTNEKMQIGILKALGFRERKIVAHYTSYGLFIGVFGSIIGIALGYGIAALIISPNGMMSTYLDLPEYKLTMPFFCVPVILITIAFLTLISFLSTKKMLVGTAADALRPYIPKPMKKLFLERRKFWKKLTFSIKWNIRNILRHKARSLMTLLGVFGCMLLIVGGLGMKDTMQRFIKMLDETSNYATKINIIENADNSEVISMCDNMNGYWQSSAGISCNGDTITLDIYGGNNDKIHILNEKNSLITPNDNGAYLCLRLKDIAKINDIIEISPYGSDKTYQLRVAGYFRSLVNESIVITEAYADKLDIEYNIDSIYCDLSAGEIESSEIIAGKHDKETLMESYDTFLEIMNLMIVILIIAAMILGIIVLYTLGTMGYLERYRELATLKVLGFRDKIIGWLLINQNIWLTIIGIIIGIPGGAGVLYVLIKTLASEYELSISIGIFTYIISIALTFGVSLLVGIIIARKSRNIDMVEALKSSE